MKIQTALARAMPAMTERNFRLFVYGQFISFAGTWLQTAAEGWLVYDLTHSAAWVAGVASLMFIPSIVLAPFGGIIVDRFDKRNVLYVTNILGMLQAFALGTLTLTGHITAPIIAILAFVLGITTAIDAPARRTLINEIVATKEHIGSASALNASLITLGQMIGPALAGLLIPLIGSGWTFIVNGVTFLAVVVTMWNMLFIPTEPVQQEHPLTMIKAAFIYAFSDKFIRFRLFLIIFLSTFAFSYRSILPVITDQVFHQGPRIFGMFSAAVGCGAFVGSVVVSLFARKLPFRNFLVIGSSVNGISLFFFGRAPGIGLAALLLFLTGFGFTLSFVTTRATLQQLLKEQRPLMTGRVLSIDYMFFFTGIAFGNMIVGQIAGRFGSPAAVTSCSLIMCAASIFFLFSWNRIRSHD